MEIDKYSKKNISVVFLALVGVIFLFFDLVGQLGFLRNFSDYIFTPIVIRGVDVSSNIKGYFLFFKDFKESKYMVSSLQERVSQLESQNIGYTSLLSKYEDLLSHSKVSSKKYSYIQSNIYSISGQYGFLVNKGDSDGVSVGDVVVYGNIYMGEITRVDVKTSYIKRPQDIGSSLPVLILKDRNIISTQTDKLNIEKSPNVKAVAIGKNEQIVVDNIPNNNGVKNGDVVVLDSQSSGEFLVLGTISNLKVDKAASVVSATIDVPVDIYSINYVYIRNDR